MRLREPDRAAVDRREHEPVEQALLALGDERAAEAEQRREEDRHPEQPELGEPRRAGRQREVEDDQDRDHEQQHRGQRVPGPQLEPQVLARERRRRRRSSYASASLPLASGATRSGSCVATRIVRALAHAGELAVEQLRALGVQPAERLVEDQQLGPVQQRRGRARAAAAGRARAWPPARAATPRGRSARAASRSARAARARGRAARRGRGSRAPSARGRRAARGRGSRSRRAPARPRACRRSGSPSPAQRRSSVVLPAPFGAGDDEEAAALELEVEPAQHALLAVVLREAGRADHRTSSSTKTKNATEITPFIVKKAVSSRRRSPGRTSECS